MFRSEVRNQLHLAGVQVSSGLAPSGGSGEEGFSLSIPASGVCCAPWFTSHASYCSSFLLLLSSSLYFPPLTFMPPSYKDGCDPSGFPGFPCLKTYVNHICKVPFVIQGNSYRFGGLGHKYFCGALIQPTTFSQKSTQPREKFWFTHRCGLETGLKGGHYHDPLLILLDCFFIAQCERFRFWVNRDVDSGYLFCHLLLNHVPESDVVRFTLLPQHCSRHLAPTNFLPSIM